MELDCNKLARAAEFPLDVPELFSTDCVEGLGQINKGRVEVTILLDAFLLEMEGSKDHIAGPAVSTAAALTFKE